MRIGVGHGLGLPERGKGAPPFPWSLDEDISDTETFSIINVTPTTTGSSFVKSAVASDADPELPGDFPTDTTVLAAEGLLNTNASWGHSGGSTDYVAGLWIGISEPITQLVASATLRVRVATVSGSPVCRVQAVNAASPVVPTGSAQTPLGLYSTAGWTHSYADFTPAAATVFLIDVTDIVNELVLNNGTTGTSILFTFHEQAGSLAVAASWNMSGYATYVSGLDIVRSLNHRDYQRALIDGSVMFYWPFDAGTSAGSGNQTEHRAVMCPVAPADGSAAEDVTDTTANIPMTLKKRPDKYGAIPVASPSEIERGGFIRQFLGPFITDSGEPGDKEVWNYGCDYRPATRDYLFFAQKVNLAGTCNIQFLLDAWGDTGMAIEFTALSGTELRCRASWSANSSPYTGKSVTVTDSDLFEVGACVSLALWYDNSANEFRFGYNAGSGWVWSTPWTDTGSTANDISGIQFGTGGSDLAVCQGWIALELEPAPTFAVIERAVAEMRALWQAGIKALPPVLFA